MDEVSRIGRRKKCLSSVDYDAGFIAGEAAERSAIVRYLRDVLLPERAAAIGRGDHKR